MKNFKEDFPLLEKQPGLTYLDSAATTQKPGIVIDTLKSFYEESNANVHRGVYSLSEKATEMLEGARKKIASMLNAGEQEIIFVKSATEGLNQLANALGEELPSENNVVVTEMEHHSNFVPWQQVSKKKNASFRVVKYADLMNKGVEAISELVDKKTKVVAFTYMSNVTGKILDVKKAVELIRKKNKDAFIVVDACQAAAHLKIDVKDTDADFICLSSHKVYGPMGTGIVYGKKEVLERINPFFYGGNMISRVSIEKSEWAKPPFKFEAGTIDAAGILASATGLEFFYRNYEEIKKFEELLKEKLLLKLREIESVNILGHEDNNYGPIVSFTIKGIHPHDFATIADREKVCVRAGHHCAQPLMNALGIAATNRASIACYNTEEDIEKLIESIKKAEQIILR